MPERKVLITGTSGSLSKAIAAWLQSKSGLTTGQISLKDDRWKDGNLGDYDIIVHVVGVTPQNTKQPAVFYEVNHKLTEEFAKKAKEAGIKQFIYLSSMAVYGLEQQINIERGTVSENTPCLPSTDYGKSKLLAEESLRELENDEFQVAIIRVPSIYGVGKTEYLDQYKHLSQKFSVIPNGFCNHYKSAIYVDSLCELIYLLIENDSRGIFCPDDGKYAAVDYCLAISTSKKKSRILGVVFEELLRKSDRIRDYYGAICYSDKLTNIFEGKYRVCSLEEAVKKSYER